MRVHGTSMCVNCGAFFLGNVWIQTWEAMCCGWRLLEVAASGNVPWIPAQGTSEAWIHEREIFLCQVWCWVMALVSERPARPSWAFVLGEPRGWTWLSFCQDLFCVTVLLLTLLALRKVLYEHLQTQCSPTSMVNIYGYLWHKDRDEQNTMILQSDFIITLTLLSRVPCRTPLLGSNRLKFNFQSSSISCTKNWLTKKPYLYWFHVFCCSIWQEKAFPQKYVPRNAKITMKLQDFLPLYLSKFQKFTLLQTTSNHFPLYQNLQLDPFPFPNVLLWLGRLNMVIWLTMIVWKALLESFSANCALYVGGYLYLLTTEWTNLAIPPICTYVFVHEFEQPKGDSFLYPVLFILHGHWKIWKKMWMHACSVLFQDACAHKGLQSLFNCYTFQVFSLPQRFPETYKFLRIGYI